MTTVTTATKKTLYVVCLKSKMDNGDALRLGYKILQQLYAGNTVEVRLGDNKIHCLDARDLILDEVCDV